MAAIKWEAIAASGKYKDSSGAEKTRFHKCGVVFESAKGLYLKIDLLPVGFDGWLSLREPREKGAAPSAGKTTTAPAKAFGDDDVPF